jgi:hypothetical protein
MDELERSAQLLREALDELRRQGMLTAQTLNRLNRATAANTAAQQSQANSVEETDKQFKRLYDTTKQVVGGFMDTAQQARRNREDFTSLNPAIRATGTMFGKTAKTIGSAASSVGDALMGLSIFLPGWWKGIGFAIGGMFKGGGAVAQAVGEEAGKAISEYGQFVTAEIQRVVESFKLMSSVGATGAMGMKGFVDMAVESGLSMEQFAKVIANNGQTLAQFNGNTLAGAKTLVNVTKAAQGFEDQFLKLGIGFEEQRDMYAKAVQRELLIGTAQRNDYIALAQSAKDYIFEINELTRITGLQRDAAQSLYDRQMADVRFQAILADAGDRLDASGKKVSAGLQAIAGTLEVRGGKTLATGFQDAISNLGTDSAKAFMLATGGAGRQIAEDYRRGRITQEEALARIDESIRRRYATLGGYKTQAALGKLGTAFETLFPEMFKVVRGSKLTVEAQKEATQGTEDAAEAQEKTTDQIVTAQRNLQRFAQELDRLVANKILPHAAHHIQLFTKALSGAIDYINQKLGVTVAPTNTGSQPAFSNTARTYGQGGTGASGDYLSRIAQLESGGRNIANIPRAGQQATSAFGVYQITKGTFESLVASAEPGSKLKGKTFEDMKADVELQTEAMIQLTASNERLLARRGLSTSDAAKYMAHMMGYGTAAKILEAPGNTPLSRIVPQDYLDKNNLSMFKNAAQLRTHFDRITGGHGYQYGGIASGPRSGYTAMLHGTEAIVPLPNGRSIPVEMTGMTDKMGEQLTMMNQQITSLNELVGLMRTNNDISTRILRSAAA